MAYEVGGIKHDDMVKMVTRRLNSLAMCKRGTLETEKNKMLNDLGPQPKYTEDERKAIEKGLEKKVLKALTPTLAMLRKASSVSSLMNTLEHRAAKIKENCFVHPDYEKWKKDRETIMLQFKEREAQLDGDFQDVLDGFILGITPITELPTEYQKLEQGSW